MIYWVVSSYYKSIFYCLSSHAITVHNITENRNLSDLTVEEWIYVENFGTGYVQWIPTDALCLLLRLILLCVY